MDAGRYNVGELDNVLSIACADAPRSTPATDNVWSRSVAGSRDAGRSAGGGHSPDARTSRLRKALLRFWRVTPESLDAALFSRLLAVRVGRVHFIAQGRHDLRSRRC